jgi:hypothetical protein
MRKMRVARPSSRTTASQIQQQPSLHPCCCRKLDHTRRVEGPILKNGVGRTEHLGERATGHLPMEPTEMTRIVRLLPGADITWPLPQLKVQRS